MSQMQGDGRELTRLRDENSRLLAELATLRQRDGRYRAILTSATGYAVIATDIRGCIIEWNAGAEAMAGWTEADILGRSIALIFTPEDCRDGVPETEMRRAVEDGRALDERWHIRKDGMRFWGSGLMMPLLTEEGTPQGYLKIMQDRSEQHRLGHALEQSGAQLQALFAAVPIGILVAEAPSGRLVAGNKRLEDLFGGRWPRSSSIAEYGTWECFHPDGRRVLADEYPMSRALRGEARPTLEALFRHDDDSRHWVSIVGAPIRDEAGDVTGALVSIESIDVAKRAQVRMTADNAALTDEVADRTTDLTESRRDLVSAETRREAAEGQVRQLQKMEAVGQLTGGVAHDFNNMLSVVISGLTLAQRRLARGDTDIGKFIDAAMDGAQRAGELTKRLLAFSRQQPLAPVALNVNRLVQGMSELLHRTLGEGVALETVLAAGLWNTQADPSQLENAVLNLAVNARDAMPDGGRLTVETLNCHLDDAYARDHEEVAAGQYVQVAVTDSGSGIPPELIGRIFEPFYTTKAVGKGTGLGLSQVYGFVKQSAGHIKAYSEPGHGTTFKIYLPRFHGTEEGVLPVRVPAAMLPGAADEIILVVEDEVRVRELTVAALRDLGYTVIHASNGPAALRQLDAHPEVALLFTDIVMPDMNGRVLADEAHRRRPRLKVLFTTGYTRSAVVHNGVLDPGVDLLGKPYSVEQIATKVRQVLDRT